MIKKIALSICIALSLVGSATAATYVYPPIYVNQFTRYVHTRVCPSYTGECTIYMQQYDVTNQVWNTISVLTTYCNLHSCPVPGGPITP